MFTGKLRHGELMDQVNALRLELFECDEVCFNFSGGNTHLFNRLFVILETDGASEISGCGKRYQLKKDAVYFLSAGSKYDFKFTSSTVLISFHFNLFFSSGMEIFSHSRIFAEELNKQQWTSRIKTCVQQPYSLHNACCLHHLIMEFVSEFILQTDTMEKFSRPFDAAVFR